MRVLGIDAHTKAIKSKFGSSCVDSSGGLRTRAALRVLWAGVKVHTNLGVLMHLRIFVKIMIRSNFSPYMHPLRLNFMHPQRQYTLINLL